MKYKSQIIATFVIGIVIGAGSLVYAATTWQGTSTLQDGTIIQAGTIKDNFDYLYERTWGFLSAGDSATTTHIANNLPVAAPAYCDENGENCEEAPFGLWGKDYPAKTVCNLQKGYKSPHGGFIMRKDMAIELFLGGYGSYDQFYSKENAGTGDLEMGVPSLVIDPVSGALLMHYQGYSDTFINYTRSEHVQPFGFVATPSAYDGWSQELNDSWSNLGNDTNPRAVENYRGLARPRLSCQRLYNPGNQEWSDCRCHINLNLASPPYVHPSGGDRDMY